MRRLSGAYFTRWRGTLQEIWERVYCKEASIEEARPLLSHRLGTQRAHRGLQASTHLLPNCCLGSQDELIKLLKPRQEEWLVHCCIHACWEPLADHVAMVCWLVVGRGCSDCRPENIKTCLCNPSSTSPIRQQSKDTHPLSQPSLLQSTCLSNLPHPAEACAAMLQLLLSLHVTSSLQMHFSEASARDH